MATKQRVHEGTVYVCAHRVGFFYRLPPKVRISEETKTCLTQEAEDRAKSQIIEGYVAGELNYESEELSCTGWWNIIR